MPSMHETALRDQAAGLRRLMSSPLSSLCTVLSADGRERKPALVNRLAASMARRGHPVMVLDTSTIAGTACDARPSLLDVAQGRASLEEVRVADATGIAHCRLGIHSDHGKHSKQHSKHSKQNEGDHNVSDGLSALGELLQQLAAEGVRLLVDAELDTQGQLPLAVLADGDIVVQLSGSEAAIRDAYDMLRALKALCGRGTVSLLVTDVDPVRARHVHANLFHAASRYLALPVRSITAPPPARRAGGANSATSSTISGNRHV